MKNKSTATLLALFFGGLGAHKFYLGKHGQGILYLVFIWTYIPFIFGIIEAIQFAILSEEKFREMFETKKLCKNCSGEVPKDAKACMHCGVSLVDEIVEKYVEEKKLEQKETQYKIASQVYEEWGKYFLQNPVANDQFYDWLKKKIEEENKATI